MTGARPKVALAQAHLRHVNPWTAVATCAGDVADLTPAAFAGIQLTIGAVDNDRARLALARLGTASQVPVVDAGVRADLFTGRVTVGEPSPDGACTACNWSADRLARAGEDVGLPCAGIEDGAPYGSTLLMAQATAALAVHQALALLGVTGEPAWSGHELRLDLHAGRLERFRRAHEPACAADHALGARGTPRIRVTGTTSLGALMTVCGGQAGTLVVLGGPEVVASAMCPGCGRRTQPFVAPAALPPCAACGTPVAALRRTRRVRWDDAAAAVGDLPASAWLRPGDVFALVDGDRARTFTVPGPGVAWEHGAPWDPGAAAARFARLPRCYDVARIRECSVAVVGLGHLGAAILQALAPLPWAGLLLVDRDTLDETVNLQSYALSAAAAEATP